MDQLVDATLWLFAAMMVGAALVFLVAAAVTRLVLKTEERKP